MPDAVTQLSEKEMALVKRIAARDGCTVEEAASRLVSEAIAKRVRRKTGKGPARVYGMGGKR